MAADPAATHVAKEIAHGRALVGGRFHPSGEYAFVGSEDFQVWRYRLSDDEKTAFNTVAWVRGMVFPSAETLITAGYDGRLIWWPALAETPVETRVVQAHEGWIRALALSPDRTKVASCGNDLKVRVWSVETGEKLAEFSGHDRHVYNVAFHPAGESLVAGDLVAQFRQWNLASGELEREFKMPTLHKYDDGFMADYGGPYCLTFSPDGTALVGGGITEVTNAFAGVGKPAMVEVNWETGEETVAHGPKGGTQGKGWGVVWHPEGFIVGATGGQGGGWLFFWKPGEKDEFHSLNLNNVARDLDLHPDGVQLLTVHHDGKLRLSRMAAQA